GGGRGQAVERLDALQEWTVAEMMPDLTLLLDVPVQTGRQRMSGRRSTDRIESEADAFFERVRATYRQRAQADPHRFIRIDASRDAATVRRQAIEAVDA